VSETRARRRIREIANQYEFVVEDIEWQPIGAMIEMSGREGGWTVYFLDLLDEGDLVGPTTEDSPDEAAYLDGIVVLQNGGLWAVARCGEWTADA
jgi:hypothetical protein